MSEAKRKQAVEPMEDLEAKPETIIVSVPVKDENGMVQRFEEKEVPIELAAYTKVVGGLGGQRKY